MDELYKKMIKVIETTEEKHREVAQRWMSLANKRCNDQLNQGLDNWGGIAGACTAIQQLWNAKFGTFYPKSESIKRVNQ